MRMTIGSIKGACSITKGDLKREEYWIELEKIDANIKEEILSILENKGRVYGLHENKNKIDAVYLFENIKEDNKKILKYKTSLYTEEAKDKREEFEKTIVELLQSEVSMGSFSRALFENKQFDAYYLLPTIKGYNVVQIKKRNLKNADMFKELEVLDSGMKEKIQNALDNNGCVYGLRQKNILKAVYIFQMEKEENDNILRFESETHSTEVEEKINDFENIISQEIRESLIFGEYSKAIWNDKEIVPNSGQKNHSTEIIVTFMVLGVAFGVLWDDIVMGIVFGLIFGVLSAIGSTHIVYNKNDGDKT